MWCSVDCRTPAQAVSVLCTCCVTRAFSQLPPLAPFTCSNCTCVHFLDHHYGDWCYFCWAWQKQIQITIWWWRSGLSSNPLPPVTSPATPATLLPLPAWNHLALFTCSNCTFCFTPPSLSYYPATSACLESHDSDVPLPSLSTISEQSLSSLSITIFSAPSCPRFVTHFYFPKIYPRFRGSHHFLVAEDFSIFSVSPLLCATHFHSL